MWDSTRQAHTASSHMWCLLINWSWPRAASHQSSPSFVHHPEARLSPWLCPQEIHPPSCPLKREKMGGLSFRRGLDLFPRIPVHTGIVAIHIPHGPWQKSLGSRCPAPDMCSHKAWSLQNPLTVYRQSSLRGVCSPSPLYQLAISRTSGELCWWGQGGRPSTAVGPCCLLGSPGRASLP